MMRLLSIALFTLTIFSCGDDQKNTDEPTIKNTDNEEQHEDLKCETKAPFALVELYTSQGCSSCPGAENTLNTLAKDDERNVIYLANHVDYWNGPLPGPCGVTAWKDPYSNKRNTDRQQYLIPTLKAAAMVTPWVVVSSKYCSYTADSEMKVALTSSAIDKKVSEELTIQPRAGIAIKQDSVDSENHTITVEYATLDADSGSEIHFVLYENGIVTEVTAGENCNKTLNGDHISRSWVTQSADAHGYVTLPVPSDAVVANCSVVAFIQNQSSRQVTAGTKGFNITE